MDAENSSDRTTGTTTLPGGRDTAATLTRLGLRKDQIVIEYGHDDDVEPSVRSSVEEITGAPVEADDYDGVVDVVLVWWRDGDGDLTDELVDSLTMAEEDGFILLFTPGRGRADRVAAHEVEDACRTCNLSASGASPLGEWMVQRLVARG